MLLLHLCQIVFLCVCNRGASRCITTNANFWCMFLIHFALLKQCLFYKYHVTIHCVCYTNICFCLCSLLRPYICMCVCLCVYMVLILGWKGEYFSHILYVHVRFLHLFFIDFNFNFASVFSCFMCQNIIDFRLNLVSVIKWNIVGRLLLFMLTVVAKY